MIQESESEEDELIVGRVPRTDGAEKDREEIGLTRGKDTSRTRAGNEENKTKEDKYQDVLNTKRSHQESTKVSQRNSSEKDPINQKNLRHSRCRKSLPRSLTTSEGSPSVPKSSKLLPVAPNCVSNLKRQTPSRIFLKVNNRVKKKETKLEKKDRNRNNKHELVVGSSLVWFDQLHSNRTDDDRQLHSNRTDDESQLHSNQTDDERQLLHSDCKIKPEEKKEELNSRIESAGPVNTFDQEAIISDLDPSTELPELDSDDELIDPSLDIDEEEYEVGDLVWARHPWNPFWPAIVKDVVPGRQSKVTVQYLNAGFDVYTCQYSLRLIRPFIRDRKKLMAEGLNSLQAENFKVAVDDAMNYLEKRALGSPVCEPRSAIDCHSMDSPPLTPTESTAHPLEMALSPGADYISSPSPELRVCHPRDTIDLENYHFDSQLEMDRENKQKWAKVEDRLMKQIFKDETKDHLMKIWKGKVKSARHATYFSSSVKDRDSLKYKAKLGALITDEKIDKVAQHLRKIFWQHCQKKKDVLPNTGYVFDVWLPEAILYATMRSHRIGEKQAEDLLSSEGRQVWRDLKMT